MKYINLVVSITIIFILVSCTDSGVNSNESKEQSAHDKIKGDWIKVMEVKEDYLTPDTAKDTSYFALDGSADSMANEIISVGDSFIKYYQMKDTGIENGRYEIDSVTDTTIYLPSDDYTVLYHFENDFFKIMGGVHMTITGTIDSAGNCTEKDTVEHWASHSYYDKYSGTVPPEEWK